MAFNTEQFLISISIGFAISLVARRFYQPKYTVIKRLGSVQLTNELSSIRISTVIVQKDVKNAGYDRGLFVSGTNSATWHEEIFPLTAPEIDEMIALLKSQPVFSVKWKGKSPISLSVDRSSKVIKLIFKRFSWMDYSFVAGIEDHEIATLLSSFELLKNETNIDHILA